MDTLKIWDLFSDALGQTPFHPQYFILKAKKQTEEIACKQANGKVLDIGCGRQKLKKSIEKNGHSYIGLDHPTIHKYQRSKSTPDILADIRSIPLPANSMDSILIFMVLDDLPQPLSGLKEVYRILKLRGKIFISVVENYPAHDLPNDYLRFRLNGIVALSKEAGFKILKTYSWGNIWQVQAVNFNTFLFQTAKAIWSKTKFLPLLILFIILFYPLTLVTNFLAIILTPLDIIKTSKLVNFVIARK